MYELMNGTMVDLSEIPDEAQEYLDGIAADAAAGVDYFALELRVKGQRAFTTRATNGWVTETVLRDPVYRAANDMVARAGIRQGTLAPPTDAKPSSLMSVPEAAKLLGQSRQNLNAAISRGALPAQRIGDNWVVKLEDVRAYKDRAERRPAPGRSVIGVDVDIRGVKTREVVLKAGKSQERVVHGKDGRLPTPKKTGKSSKHRTS